MPSTIPDDTYTVSRHAGEAQNHQCTGILHRLAAGLLLPGLLSVSGAAIAAYGVQVGAFAQPENATRLAERITSAGFTATVLPQAKETDRLKTVVVGPFPDKSAARAASRLLAANDWYGYIRDYPVASDGKIYTAGKDIDGQTRSPSEAPFRTDLNDQVLRVAEAPAGDSPTGGDVLIIEETTTGSGTSKISYPPLISRRPLANRLMESTSTSLITVSCEIPNHSAIPGGTCPVAPSEDSSPQKIRSTSPIFWIPAAST